MMFIIIEAAVVIHVLSTNEEIKRHQMTMKNTHPLQSHCRPPEHQQREEEQKPGFKLMNFDEIKNYQKSKFAPHNEKKLMKGTFHLPHN